MAETLTLPQTTDRAVLYASLLPQLEALIKPEPDLIANLANTAAALKQTFGFFWVGFYSNNGHELVLGPFQGPIACTRIGFGRGVCGAAYTSRQTIIVPDVEQFPGHIACSSASKSEIVVPIFDKSGHVRLVLDVDSDQPADFGPADQAGLERIAALLTTLFP